MKIRLHRYPTDFNKKVEVWILSKSESMQEALRRQTISQSLYDMLKEETTKANHLIKSEDPNADELGRIVAPVMKAAKDYNMSKQMDRLKELAKLPYDEAVVAYIADQSADGLAPVNIKETKEIENMACKTYIKPYDFFNNLNQIAMPIIRDLSWLYLDNAMKFWVNLSSDEYVDENGETKLVASGVNKPYLSSSWTKLRNRFGWNEEPSKTTMKKQLATVWKWMLGDAAPTHKEIRVCDAMYVVNAAMSAVDKMNGAGSYKICSDAEFINYIFRAAMTCRVKGTYDAFYRGKRRKKIL